MTHNDILQQDDEQAASAVTDLLRTFAAQPSGAFHARHADAPWVRPEAPAPRRMWSRRVGLLAGMAVMAIALWVALPAGFAAAVGEFLGFYRAPSDIVDASGPVGGPLPTVATVAEAESVVGFDIRTPAALPPEATHSTIALMGDDPQTTLVMINYVDAQQMSQLSLTVRRSPMSLQIGATAAVETVQIGDLTGEYVMGGFISNGQTAQWNPDYPSKTLSWTEGDISYQLNSSRLSKAELIALAAGMQ